MAKMASTHLYAEGLDMFRQAVLERHRDIETQRLLNDFLLDGKSHFSTPDAARQAAERLATDAGERYSGIRIGKIEVVPKEWVDAVLGNIDSIVTAGSSMVKSAPESVGLAWFAISLTLKAISNNYALYALFGKGLTDITEVMIIIVHYDRLYDERQKSGFRVSSLVDKLFRETVAAYAAVLDFSFSVKRHMSGGAIDKLRHGIKDFFNVQASKFQEKLSYIADLKDKILESSQGAFQDKTMQQFEVVQTVLSQIHQRQSQALELQQEQNQVLNNLLEDFKELKDFVKRKTPWDFLKEEFTNNKKKLAPLSVPHQEINKLLASKQIGTCEWIFADEKYQSWKKSDESTILCFSGGPGSGKSILLASLAQKFEATADTNGPFINYVSCTTDDHSQAAALGEQKLSRICNTLLYQVYELAAIDSSRLSLLETCNQAFRNPKSHKAGLTSGRGLQSEDLPDFVDAMGKLVTALERDTIIIIDAVGTLSLEDQNELYSILQELIADSLPKKISILVGSRSDSAFTQRSLSATACIDVSNYIRADMEAVLDSRLKDLSGWLDSERQLAKETVLTKAGTRFSYINDVALPFLKQPFQRPVSNFLRRLPDGLNESFEQAISAMPQNYFELLQLSVTWCLLAPRMVTAKEIVEAYSGVYTVTEDGGVLSPRDMAQGDYDPNASDLEVQQIIHASGPFLSTERTDDGQTMVKLQDARQVKKFCERPVETQHAHNGKVSLVCENCKSAISTRSFLSIDPRLAHFEIALTLLRHLNNPLFQRRFHLLNETRTSDTQDSSHESGGTGVVKLAEDQTDDSKSLSNSTSDAIGAKSASENLTESNIAVLPTNQNIPDDPPAEQGESGLQEESQCEHVQDNSEDVDNYTEPSIDEDLDNYDYTKSSFSDANKVDAEISLYDCTPQLRCEINNWPYHLREAENLWPLQERRTSEVWARFNCSVQEELKKFVDNQDLFYNWQKAWGVDRYILLARGQLKPLHLAALLGLDTWAETLLDNNANINESCGGVSVSQASGIFARFHRNVDLLRLLLAKGADFYEFQENYLPGFHLWLDQCNNPETVKAFIDNGANFDTKDSEGWTGLHSFAWTGVSAEAFGSILCPQGSLQRPNINAEDNKGETPLHRLLWRREVPLNLLRAFLAVEGINVNHDDSDSQQPLGVASYWGSLEVVKLLLEAGADVKDTDKTGRTAMHRAAQGDHVKCLDVLLHAHSELDARDHGGSTALQHAAYCGRKAAVELLVSRGSDLNSTNNHNRTPFFNATRCLYGDQETAHYLLVELRKRGYSARDINKCTKGGRTPLRQASHRGFGHVVRDLLECINESGDEDVKATINQRDEKLKRTPLHCAARRGDAECVRLLLEHGADATLEDGENQTALVIAQEQWALRDEDSFEQVLLQLIDQDQKAAIADAELPAIAAARGNVRVLQKLHSLRADLNRTDSLGWNPLAHAKHLGHKDAEFFLKHQSSWGGALPSKWVDKRSPSVLDEHGLQVTYTTYERTCVVSDKPLPPSVERFYFEVTLESMESDSQVAVGFCTLGAQAHEFPGWMPKDTASFATSWGYHCDDGGHFHKNQMFPLTNTRKPYGAGDTVGCGVDLESHKMWFTKNGEKLNYEFENVRGRLYPILGMAGPLMLMTNFGLEEFKWRNELLQVANDDNST